VAGQHYGLWGIKDQFQPPRPSVRYRFDKPTLAGTLGKGSDAPSAARRSGCEDSVNQDEKVSPGL